VATLPTDKMMSLIYFLLFVGGTYYFLNRNTKPVKSFKGKTVVITGASSGIGKAVALRYASLGAKLVLAARRKDELDSVVESCKKEGAEAISVLVDVTKEDDCKKMIDTAVSQYGSIDLLFCNAGRASLMPVKYVHAKEFDFMKTMVDVNFYGCVYPAVFALEHLRRSKGSVAVVSSLSAKTPSEGRAFYGATKSALNTWFSCLRIEEPDISVTILNPGFVSSEINKNSFTPKGMKRFMEESDKMPTDVCAKIMEDCIARGVLEENMTIKGKLGNFLFQWFPAIFDVVSRRQSEFSSKLVAE